MEPVHATALENLLGIIKADADHFLARRGFLALHDEDAALLATLHEKLIAHHGQFSARFFDHLHAFPSLQKFLRGHDLERFKQNQSAYFASLSKGRYDREFVRGRIASSLIHQRMGLPPEWFLGAYRMYLAELMPVVWRICEQDFDKFEAAFGALSKIIFFDIGIAFDMHLLTHMHTHAHAQATQHQDLQVQLLPPPHRQTRQHLQVIAGELSKLLEVRYVMVTHVNGPDFTRACALMLTDYGKVAPEFNYPLVGSPCADVIQEAQCMFPSDVRTLFPLDVALLELGAESYAGITIHGTNGEPLGILAVLDDAPFVEIEKINRLLKTFAPRVATELMQFVNDQSQANNETHFHAAFHQAAVGIAHASESGQFLLINSQLCHILGYEQAELLGKNLLDVTHVEDREKFGQQMAQLIVNPEALVKAEKRYIRKDGAMIWGQMNLSVVKRQSGDFAYFLAVLEDISGRKNLEYRLRLSNRALASSGNGVIITDATDPSAPILFANPAFCRITGYSFEEVVGRNCSFLQNGDDEQPELSHVRTAIAKQEEVHVVLRNYRKDGSLFWNDLFISPVPDETGKVTHFIGVQTDVTEQKRNQEQLAFQATHDELTGLPNRNLLNDRLPHALVQASRRKNSVALLFLDIDHFKLINDSLGHAAGDQLLKGFADRLSACIRGGDTVSRHGGDEFVIVLRDIEQGEHVTLVCDNIFHAIAEPFLINEQKIHATCSIGIALFPQDGNDAATLSKFADMALYRAKDLGRGNYQFFSNEMNQRTLERVTLESALRLAITHNQLYMNYQPLVDLQTGRMISMEALVRWVHPDLGIISPDRFIPVAEESGLIGNIGEWVLRRACLDMRTWLNKGLPGIRVAVNVSPKQFRDAFLADKIEASLAEMGIEPCMLTLEITETVLMQDTALSEATLRRLKALGVSLALDDFGTGYSSLSYLKRFPFDRVKIDRAFVRDSVTDADDAALCKTIISMAHSLGIKVVAEGVETEEQCEFLRRNMCDEIQGYLFSRPLSQMDVENLQREGRRLPDHLLRIQNQQRSLMLVASDLACLQALTILLARPGIRILSAANAEQALDLLEREDIDVIVSEQRLTGIDGAAFLRKAKQLAPEAIRFMLADQSEMPVVTDAFNDGVMHQFFAKPWHDQQLREHINDALTRQEIVDENQTLQLKISTANHELAAANRKIEEILRLQQQQISRDEASLNIAREVLQYLPLPAIGLDDEGIIVFINDAAEALFGSGGLLLGNEADQALPEVFGGQGLDPLEEIEIGGVGQERQLALKGCGYRVTQHSMGASSSSRGKLITLTQCKHEGERE